MVPLALEITAANNKRQKRYSRQLLEAPSEQEGSPLYRFFAIQQSGSDRLTYNHRALRQTDTFYDSKAKDT